MKVALIGYGFWGPKIFRCLNKLNFVSEIVVCDVSLDALKKIEPSQKKVITSQKIDVVLDDDSIETVFVATPIRTHFAIAKSLLDAGKNVFLEKPMAFSSEEGQILVDLSKSKKRLLHIDNTFVYSKEVNFLKEYLKFDILGKPLYFRSTRANLGPFLTNTTVIEDLVTHDISIINYLFPDKVFHSVSATGAANINTGVCDDSDITLFARDFTAHIHVSWVYPRKTREIIIGGTQSIICHDSARGEYPEAIEIKTGYRKQFKQITDLGEPLFVEINHFFERLFRNDTTLSNGNEGLKIVRVLEATKKSLNLNGAPVELEY